MTEDFQSSALNSGFAIDAVNIMSEGAIEETTDTQHQESPANRQSSIASSPSVFNLPTPIQSVEQIWFTRMRADLDRPKAPSSTTAQPTPPIAHISELTDVDDQYRLRLSKAVHTLQPPDGPLPSSDFLVPNSSCVARKLANHVRIYACECTLHALILYSQSCIVPHFDPLQKIAT